MHRKRLHFTSEYRFVEPGITADGVRIYPFDRSFPIDVSFQRVSGIKPVRLNRHEFCEVIYIYAGRAEIQILDRLFPAKTGDLVIIGPHLYHRLRHKPNVEARVASLNFQAEIIRSDKTDTNEESYLAPFFCDGSDFPHVIADSRRLSRQVFDLIRRIHDQLPAQAPLGRLAVKTYLKMMLLHLLQHYEQYLETREILANKQKDLQRLEPLFRFLDQKFAQLIEVQDAAQVCAMSASHFMRFFKATMGQPFRTYLTSLRIANAQRMLAVSDAPIAEISQNVGFCSQSYFGEVFHDLVGKTPRAYRRAAIERQHSR